jgi:probable rRNA maturation factor
MSSGDHIVLFRRAPAELDRPQLERFARILRDEVCRGAAFQCLVSDDRELRRLNRQFLERDYPTDVLSFPNRDPQGASDLGEMAISAERAKAQARTYGHSTNDEICILMLHGVLHLMGMDHETDRGEMRRAESRWRMRLGLPQGLVERATA